MIVQLKTRTRSRSVEAKPGNTILETALQHGMDWGFSCSRGTCARCRSWIASGREHLAPPSDAERERLEPEELEDGYRLGCQARLLGGGDVSAVHKPYF